MSPEEQSLCADPAPDGPMPALAQLGRPSCGPGWAPAELALMTGNAGSLCHPYGQLAGGPRGDLHIGEGPATGPGPPEVGPAHLWRGCLAHMQFLGRPEEGSRAPAAGALRACLDPSSSPAQPQAQWKAGAVTHVWNFLPPPLIYTGVSTSLPGNGPWCAQPLLITVLSGLMDAGDGGRWPVSGDRV